VRRSSATEIVKSGEGIGKRGIADVDRRANSGDGMKIKKSLNVPVKDYPVHAMPPYTIGVLTRVPKDWSIVPGDLVYRGCSEVSFPESKTWCSNPGDSLRYRPLKDGEVVSFEGETQ
jgi:hypothetical protein